MEHMRDCPGARANLSFIPNFSLAEGQLRARLNTAEHVLVRAPMSLYIAFLRYTQESLHAFRLTTETATMDEDTLSVMPPPLAPL